MEKNKNKRILGIIRVESYEEYMLFTQKFYLTILIICSNIGFKVFIM